MIATRSPYLSSSSAMGKPSDHPLSTKQNKTAKLSEVTINIRKISQTAREEVKELKEHSLKRSIKQRLGELPDENEVPDGFLISRIPHGRRERNKIYLDPQLVSIGPYHRQSENLRAMEKQKVWFLRAFLARYPGVSVEELIEKMKSLESRARQFYSENIELDSDQFVEMLLLDACFIAEIVAKGLSVGGINSTKLGFLRNKADLFSDMLLIENQIPFFVLESISHVSDFATFLGTCDFLGLNQTQWEPPSCPIAHLVHLYYELNIPLERTLYKSNSKSPTSIKLKQLFASIKPNFLSRTSHGSKKINIKEPVFVIPSASELHEVGVTFKKKQSPLNLLDITFNKGIIEMPPILMDDVMHRLLLNLLTFEQSKGTEDFLFLSSYLNLLMYIVRTSKDMTILRRCGIIINAEANEEESALFFNRVGDIIYIGLDTDIFSELYSDIKDYYEGSWHKHEAKLKRNYFNSPWSIISLGAGVVLLVLTFLQTVYGIKSYKQS